jgi:hypothetical protein
MALQAVSQELGAESDHHSGTVLDRVPSWLSNGDIIVMRTKCNKKNATKNALTK